MKLHLTAGVMNACSPKRKPWLRAAYYCVVVLFGLGLLISSSLFDRGDSEDDVTSSVRMASLGKPVPKSGGTYRVGDPYVMAGRVYTPREEPTYRAEGTASWYGEKFHGRLTANGEFYDMHAVSAAHPTLPLPSYVRVTNLANRRSLIVRLNDRGPYRDNRLIDVSVRTAKLLGFYDQGLAPVRVDYIGPAELKGSDDEKLVATLRDDDPPTSQISPDGKPSDVKASDVKMSDVKPSDVKAPDARSPDLKPLQTLFPKEIYD